MVVIHILLFVVKNLFVNIKLKLLQLHPLTKNIWFRLWLHPNREYTASDILGTLCVIFAGGTFMEVSRILKMDCSETEKLGMLFSGRMDAMNVMGEGCGAVTIKVWDDLFQDLIAWKNAPEKTTHNKE